MKVSWSIVPPVRLESSSLASLSGVMLVRGGRGGCPAPDTQLRVDSNELEILLSDVSTFLLAVPVLPAGHHGLQLDI